MRVMRKLTERITAREISIPPPTGGCFDRPAGVVAAVGGFEATLVCGKRQLGAACLDLDRCVRRVLLAAAQPANAAYVAPGLRVLPRDACRLPGRVPGLSRSKAYATNIWLRHS